MCPDKILLVTEMIKFQFFNVLCCSLQFVRGSGSDGDGHGHHGGGSAERFHSVTGRHEDGRRCEEGGDAAGKSDPVPGLCEPHWNTVLCVTVCEDIDWKIKSKRVSRWRPARCVCWSLWSWSIKSPKSRKQLLSSTIIMSRVSPVVITTDASANASTAGRDENAVSRSVQICRYWLDKGTKSWFLVAGA